MNNKKALRILSLTFLFCLLFSCTVFAAKEATLLPRNSPR